MKIKRYVIAYVIMLLEICLPVCGRIKHLILVNQEEVYKKGMCAGVNEID